LVLSASALAAPLPGAAIESPVARFLFAETNEGIEMMGRYLGRAASASDVDEFLRGIREAGPAYAHVRQDLEIQIGRLREELQRARVARNGGRKTTESDQFTTEEQLVLREAAKHEFSLSGDALPPDPRAGNIRFAESERLGLEASREDLLNPKAIIEDEGVLRIKAEPLDEAPVAIREEARKGFKDWASDAQTCLENRPDKVTKAKDKRDLLQQLAINAGVNTGAYLLTSGISHFDVGSFSVDMLISMLSTSVSMSWMSSADSFRVRWLKVYSWGRIRTRLDAEIYQVLPWTNTHGAPMTEAAREREQFNRSWSVQTSIINPVMFTILNGAECMIEQSAGAKSGAKAGAAAARKFAKRAAIVKFGVGAGMSYLYYNVRSNYLNSKKGGK
jgi:hypothetical protein